MSDLYDLGPALYSGAYRAWADVPGEVWAEGNTAVKRDVTVTVHNLVCPWTWASSSREHRGPLRGPLTMFFTSKRKLGIADR